MRNIEISDSTYSELAKLAEPFESPDSVIARLILEHGASFEPAKDRTPQNGRLFSNREIQERISRVASKLTPSKLHELCDASYSKETFGINFPLLVRLPVGARQEDKSNLVKSADGVNRWTWKFGFISDGYEYAICTQWYDYNDKNVKYWLSRYESEG
ncbi:hypothetical protein [Vibrio mangrovi]|uniref:Uncharacterized protein n=1 Tax=Vibrio mangrovi TaxID=474394 RepID=A0A1Y6IY16_9VIBR|nr:hypothetical protein [Vibrio mangrovi]MDW6005235.1 hypothetical protein [Vibrio mangrovi]SMS02554.1 hypothetical protein VIM7927_03887 [Vibrio mangrovi]